MSTKTCNMTWLAASLVALSVTAHAEVVNRCVGADGKVSYSDTACSPTAKSAEKFQVKIPVPATPAKDATANVPIRPDLKSQDEEFQKRRIIRERQEEEARNQREAAARAESAARAQKADKAAPAPMY